jgi:hypothetical protein
MEKVAVAFAALTGFFFRYYRSDASVMLFRFGLLLLALFSALIKSCFFGLRRLVEIIPPLPWRIKFWARL